MLGESSWWPVCTGCGLGVMLHAIEIGLRLNKDRGSKRNWDAITSSRHAPEPAVQHVTTAKRMDMRGMHHGTWHIHHDSVNTYDEGVHRDEQGLPSGAHAGLVTLTRNTWHMRTRQFPEVCSRDKRDKLNGHGYVFCILGVGVRSVWAVAAQA